MPVMNQRVVFIGLLCIGLSEMARSPSTCPAGMTYIAATNICYYMDSTSTDFTNAQAVCQTQGANLGSITHQADIDWIINTASAMGLTSGANFLWVGAIDPTGNWEWSDGSQPFQSCLWAPNQPTPGYTCAGFVWITGAPNNGSLYSAPCTDQQWFVCEKPASIGGGVTAPPDTFVCATTTTIATTTLAPTLTTTATTVATTTTTTSTTTSTTTTTTTTSASTTTTTLAPTPTTTTTTVATTTTISTTTTTTTTPAATTTTTPAPTSTTTTTTVATTTTTTSTTTSTTTTTTTTPAATTTTSGVITTTTTASAITTTTVQTPYSKCTPLNGLWSMYSISVACNDTCGLCGREISDRMCYSNGAGGCSGPSTNTTICANELCQYPRDVCCAPYKKTVVNTKNVCA